MKNTVSPRQRNGIISQVNSITPSAGLFHAAESVVPAIPIATATALSAESRTESAPTVPGSTAFRRMALSEAIPIITTAWVSQAQPILRKAPRRKPKVQGGTGVGADFVRDWVHRPRRMPRWHEQPVGWGERAEPGSGAMAAPEKRSPANCGAFSCGARLRDRNRSPTAGAAGGALRGSCR